LEPCADTHTQFRMNLGYRPGRNRVHCIEIFARPSHRHAGAGGPATYALDEMLSWRVDLARLKLRPKAFYVTIAVGMELGVALNFTPIDPIRAL
jgi:hypothetical protein